MDMADLDLTDPEGAAEVLIAAYGLPAIAKSFQELINMRETGDSEAEKYWQCVLDSVVAKLKAEKELRNAVRYSKNSGVRH